MGDYWTYLTESRPPHPGLLPDVSSVSTTSEEMVRVRCDSTVFVGVGGKGRRDLMWYRGWTQPTLPFFL